MIINAKYIPIEPKFKPIKLEITIETPDELNTFKHLLGCWNDASRCFWYRDKIMNMTVALGNIVKHPTL